MGKIGFTDTCSIIFMWREPISAIKIADRVSKKQSDWDGSLCIRNQEANISSGTCEKDVCVCLCMCMCVCAHVHMSLCICVHVHMCLNSVYVCAYVNICMFVSLCMCVYVFMRVYVCMRIVFACEDWQDRFYRAV